MKYLFFPVLLLISGALAAQLDVFAPVALKNPDPTLFEQRLTPPGASFYQVATPEALAEALAAAPQEEQFTGDRELLLTLPDPQGQKTTFRITRYQMINPALQAAYPTYVTAFGWDVAAPHRKIFLDWTAHGFGASITGGEEGRWYVEPVYRGHTSIYQSFYTRDYPRQDRDESCGFVPDPNLVAELEAFGHSNKTIGDCQLREYDLALACTGEYYNAVGGNEAAVVTEMIRAINRVNEVFRSDLAIQLTIINLPTPGDGIQLVYNNPASDPYTNDDGSAMLGENQANVNAVIGSANYDIGHVFSTGGGGIASLASPCSSFKAQGVTGLPNPTGDPFYIDYVAHEIGHQFGGNHTFNSTESSCATRNNSTAYEPGGGTTIQAYAGICGSTANIQLSSDPYYHAVSLQEISTYMELGGGSVCADVAATSNTAPVVNGGADYTIPANTPFVLTATGSDGDGDALTYCWEQFDLGPVVAGEPTGNETNGPLFRSRPPTPSPERYFPNLPSLVAGGGAPWEVLPLQTRNLTFLVTLRDFGAAGYGCAVQDDVEVNVVNTGQQYAVLAPNGGEVWQTGSNQTVAWAVAGTDANGINCSMVDIVLSTDGGLTFNQVLATVPNNGSASVTAPATTETSARIMIRCSDNIFFDISDGDFSIEQTDYDFQPVNGTATVCEDATTATFSFTLESLQGYTGTINYAASGLPAGATASFQPPATTLTAGATETVTLTVNGLGSLPPDFYAFQVSTNDGTTTKSEDFFLEILPPLATPVLLTPADNGFLPLDAAAFDWESVDNATTYRIDFYTDAAGTMSVGGLGGLSISGVNFGDNFADDYANGDMLFWKVTAFNNNCNPQATSVSAIQKFTFGTMASGSSLAAGGSPLEICSGEAAPGGLTVSFFNGDLTGPATLSSIAAPPGVGVGIAPSVLNDGGTAAISLTGEENLAPGTYTITIQANDGSTTETIDLTLEVLGEFNVITPVNDTDFPIGTNMACPGPNNYVIFVDFQFDAYTGAAVTDYTLYVSEVGGGFFNPATVEPGIINTRGYCTEPDQEYVFTIEANLASGGTVVSCTGNFFARLPLPVTWHSFQARARGKAAQLEWSVEQDLLHAGFTVERQQAGRTDWQSLDYVPAAGPAGPAAYTYQDETVQGGQTYLYRLRQEDRDGQFSYSVIRRVTLAPEGAALEARPNPAADQVIISVGREAPEKLTYQLFNSVGQVVATGALRNGQARIALGELPPAIYTIRVTDGKGFQQMVRLTKR